MDRAFYAIGMGEWVEVREAQKPPTSSTSKVKVQAKIPDYSRYLYDAHGNMQYDRVTGSYLHPEIEKTTTLSQTIFRGGRVLGSLRRRRFNLLSGFSPNKGACIQIPPDRVPSLLERLRHE